MAEQDTLCGWGNGAKVAYYLENAEVIIPRRREQITFVAQHLPWPLDASIAVVDLGSGFGAISTEILNRYPKSTVTCVDGSPHMMALARDRLAKYGVRVRFHLADLAHPSWRDGLSGPFDAAVSGLAIHHLTDERKRGLYCEVLGLLRPGGLFANNDIVAAPPSLKARFEAIELIDIQEQDRAKRGIARPIDQIQAEMREQLRQSDAQHHSHIASLAGQLAWLTEAGFKSVDCYWKYLDFAVFGGAKE
jgi:cyclopropane fatty-acyl-phospholipid synthase-like methyltransferase